MAGEYSIVRQATLPAAIGDCWRFLTVPSLLAEWFADVEGGLFPGQRFVFRFGDGDFFVCEGLRTMEPLDLEFRWRFMGVGLVSGITYRLQPLEEETRISVIDQGQYSSSVARELEEGWEDFLSRLDRRIRTGANTRYRWTEYISASAILAVSSESAFEMCLTRLTSRAVSSDVRIEPHLSQGKIEVNFRSAAWGGRETKAVLSFMERENGTKLSLIHSGWASLDSEIQFGERKRFAGFWADFLEQLETNAKPLDSLVRESP
jgi:uncharacterized protein YndB with AHSA1/START domain